MYLDIMTHALVLMLQSEKWGLDQLYAVRMWLVLQHYNHKREMS